MDPLGILYADPGLYEIAAHSVLCVIDAELGRLVERIASLRSHGGHTEQRDKAQGL